MNPEAHLHVGRAPGPAQPIDLIARAFRPGGFPAFCALLRIVDIETGKRVPMRLTWIQRSYNAKRSPRDIILKPRKVFMTTLEIARDLWWFLTRRGARVVIVCQSEQGNAAKRTVRGMLRVALESIREMVSGIGSSDPRRGGRFDVETDDVLEWRERDATLRIMEAGAAERTAAKGGRAQTVNRLHATELAFWEFGAETLNSLLNAMPPNSGEVVYESTPNGASGYYHEQWQAAVAGKNGFTPHFFPWWTHAGYRTTLEAGEAISLSPEEKALAARGVSPEALKWYRTKQSVLGPQKAAQEFPTDPDSCFLLSGREFFDIKTTLALLSNASAPRHVEPLRGSGVHGELRVWGRPERDKQYVLSADTSEGTGGDESAGILREVGTGLHVATISGQIKPGEYARILAKVAITYNNALIAVERNGPGLTTLDRLLSVLQPERVAKGLPALRVFHDRDEKPGWHTNVASRPAALAGLEQGQRDGTWRSLDQQTLTQMKLFVWREKSSGNVKAEAAPGEHDDLIMAEAIGWDVLRRPILTVVRDLDALG